MANLLETMAMFHSQSQLKIKGLSSSVSTFLGEMEPELVWTAIVERMEPMELIETSLVGSGFRIQRVFAVVKLPSFL